MRVQLNCCWKLGHRYLTICWSGGANGIGKERKVSKVIYWDNTDTDSAGLIGNFQANFHTIPIHMTPGTAMTFASNGTPAT